MCREYSLKVINLWLVSWLFWWALVGQSVKCWTWNWLVIHIWVSQVYVEPFPYFAYTVPICWKGHRFSFLLEFQRITSYCFVPTKFVMKLCAFISGRKYRTYVMLKTKLVFSLFDRLLALKIKGFYSQDNYYLFTMLRCPVCSEF